MISEERLCAMIAAVVREVVREELAQLPAGPHPSAKQATVSCDPGKMSRAELVRAMGESPELAREVWERQKAARRNKSVAASGRRQAAQGR